MSSTSFQISDIEEIILAILENQDGLYGLQISKIVETGSDGRLQINFGSLYPALRRLETRKFVTSHWGEDNDKGGARRRYYKITQLGKETLTEKRHIRDNIIRRSGW